MSLTYLQIDSAITGIDVTGLTGSAALNTRIITAIGKFCYGLYAESPSTPDHPRRQRYARWAFGRTTPNEITHYRTIARTVAPVVISQGASGSTTDAALQTLVNAVMENLIASFAQ